MWLTWSGCPLMQTNGYVQVIWVLVEALCIFLSSSRIKSMFSSWPCRQHELSAALASARRPSGRIGRRTYWLPGIIHSSVHPKWVKRLWGSGASKHNGQQGSPGRICFNGILQSRGRIMLTRRTHFAEMVIVLSLRCNYHALKQNTKIIIHIVTSSFWICTACLLFFL